MLPHIPPSEIATPWDAQPIAWRHASPLHRADAINAQIDAGYDYIVREVLVRHPEHIPSPGRRAVQLTLDQCIEATELATSEFELMAEAGLVAAPTQWHSFLDEEGRARTLARVAVVDGEPYSETAIHRMTELELAAASRLTIKVNRYVQAKKEGRRLADVDSRKQFQIGTLRPKELRHLTPSPTDCFHDTEPVFWLYWTRGF